MTDRRPSSVRTPSDLLREAAAAARAGDRSEAERLYRRVLEREPQNVEAWLGLGSVREEAGQKIECFERVLQLDPDNADAAASLERLRAVRPAQSETMTCAFHPRVETVLRCSQCGRPICVRCAQPYPVGQLCPICVRGRRPLVYEVDPVQLTAAGGATLVVSALLGLAASYVLVWGLGLLLAILGGPAAGSLLAQVALRVGQRRRGRIVQITVGGCIVVGSVLGAILLNRLGVLNLPFWIYLALAVGSAVSWLR